MIFPYILVFIFGLAAGSFINSVTLRYNTGEKVTRGRSRCFNCAKNLRWFELIPLLSFLFLRGRCRSCRSKISWQYPAVEILTGILFLLVSIKWSSGDHYEIGILAYWLIVCSILIAIAVYDARHKIIPDSFAYSLLAVSLAGNLIFFKINLVGLALSIAPALFLASLWYFSGGRWMGLGDAKLMSGGGVFLGFPSAIWAMVLSFWAGAAVGISLLLSNSGVTLKSEIPFGPFLVLGILLAFFYV